MSASGGHLPLRDDKRAPRFKGKKVDEFIVVLEHLAQANGVDEKMLPKAVLRYSSSKVKSVLTAYKEFEGDDWDAAKAQLQYVYGSMTRTSKASPKRLRRFVQETFRSGSIVSYMTLDRYNIKFCEKAASLVQDGLLSGREYDDLFYRGLPKRLRRAILSDLTQAVMVRTAKPLSENNPPTKTEVLDTARAYYKADAINESSDSDSASSSSDEDSSSSDSEGDTSDSSLGRKGKKRASSVKPSRKKREKASRGRTRSRSDSELPRPTPDFNREFQAMAQKWMRDMMRGATATGAATAASLSHSTSGSPYHPLASSAPMPYAPSLPQAYAPRPAQPRRCYVCTKTEGVDLDHSLGMANCPETARLISDKLAVFSSFTGKLAYPNGAPLPPPHLLPKGIAAFLREQQPSATQGPPSQQRDPPPHLASVMSVGLCRDGVPLFAYSPESESGPPNQAYSFPVTTRSTAKNARAQDTAPTPTNDDDQPPPAASSPPATTVPPQAPDPANINTERGWNDARKERAHTADLLAPPVRPSYNRSNLRFSSAVQDSVSLDSVEDTVLNTKITLSLRECLAMSAALQKRVANLVKVRRDFDGRPDRSAASDPTRRVAEAVLDDLPTGERAPSLAAELSFQQGSELLDDILERYSASVALGQPRWFAMVSGTVEAVWGGQRVTLLVDSGSELNLISKSVFEASGLKLDEDGARWSLRGIGGSAVSLLGCCCDAPMQLGGKNFDHHFFVSSVDRAGAHDGILGQPWLSYFSALFDYSRTGTTFLRVFPSGSREGASVTLKICPANHPRNADRLVLSATVEEVPDQGDF